MTDPNLAPADQAARMAENAGREFGAGEIDRAEFIQRLGHVLHMSEDTVTQTGPLRSEGRLSFGRSREGQDGVAIWFPKTVLPDRPPGGIPRQADE